ncbi:hypothetical protein L6452_36025 [Arctium lappa]|uniref:Uncharacterized protein n=1 Tax=Arctium lappa TaxID=4217 RepID=A0ACB8Y851_ARCLA|nr:hypothetical protein L6452_36025 [Arctium lappa]
MKILEKSYFGIHDAGRIHPEMEGQHGNSETDSSKHELGAVSSLVSPSRLHLHLVSPSPSRYVPLTLALDLSPASTSTTATSPSSPLVSDLELQPPAATDCHCLPLDQFRSYVSRNRDLVS